MKQPLSHLDQGILVGLLVAHGSFGGDGRQPQITLRLHTRHEQLMRWLTDRFPESRLYGPYNHGGRHYFQWQARGKTLVNDMLPILDEHLTKEVDPHTFERLQKMKERYGDAIRRAQLRS